MNKILYMACTINGMIAEENDETPWSQEEWKSYNKKVVEIGNVIIGRRTFELMKKDGSVNEFSRIPIVVLSRQSDKRWGDTNIHVATNPRAAISLLSNKGYAQALIAGGSKTNSSFLKEGLIDEIYLDIEPRIFGKGIHLVDEDDFRSDLMLISTKKIGKNTVQLHYKMVTKNRS